MGDQLLTEICNNTDTGPASAWIQAVKFGNTHTNCHPNGAGESFEGEKTQAECRALCERNHRCVATVQADRSGRGKVTGRENCWLKNRCDEVAHREGRLVSFHFNRQAALNHMRLLPMSKPAGARVGEVLPIPAVGADVLMIGLYIY